MSDLDANGVDKIERFKAYSERFIQFSVAQEVYLDTLQYILQLREERDDLRRAILEGIHPDVREAYAKAKEWDLPDCFKENTND
jgi:hypothetical protein